jgi:hypothetical protein
MPMTTPKDTNRPLRVRAEGGGGNRAVGVAGEKECNVLKLAALVLAAASTTSTPVLKSSSPWWEKVTVTLASDGNPRSCSYETSLKPQETTNCEVSGSTDGLAPSPGSAKDEYTRITFERRFNPGAQPDSEVQAGDTLIGSQVMALAIDGEGAVKGCRIVSKSGTMTPDYGCEEATAERFEASANARIADARQAYMTILVYGHDEHIV